uniref:Uncharacterized protein n=1 Tax=Anguilla anguilla TaxID=7936 RepID=A0A0E9XC63_ANGAN
MLKAMPKCMALASINQIYLYSVFYGSCHNALYGQPWPEPPQEQA